jgi:putative serine protease PepD
MNTTRRAWRIPAAAALAGALLGTGITAASLGDDPAAAAGVPPAASAPAGAGPAPAGAAAAAGTATQSYAPVVRQVVPSVVLIRTASGLGSGVILDDRGNIVTNAHVTGTATRFEVQLAGDPAPRSARLVGSYAPDDLAVIRADDAEGLTPARFADSGRVKVGDVVLAVGNPLGLTSSVTEGIVSATGRAVTEPATPQSPGATLPGAIQTSAPINPGNSGGALVSLSGQVVGIPTLAAASPASGAPAPGIGFAIPSNVVRDVAGQIIATGQVTDSHRAAIGAQVATIAGFAGQPDGAGIVAVTPGGPADRAGLRAGDVIRSAGGAPIPGAEALSQALARMRPGQAVKVVVVRDQQPHTVQVTLGQVPGS